MKKIQHKFHCLQWLILLMGFFFSTAVLAQNEEKQAKMDSVKAKVESKNYTFHATNAIGKRGRNNYISGDQNKIVVKPDLIKCDLPFYGESYGGAGGYAPTSDGPLTFESKEFKYEIKPRKKGGWNIYIKPGDAAGIQEIVLSIGTTGYTSVTVSSTNRSAMNYTGEVF